MQSDPPLPTEVVQYTNLQQPTHRILEEDKPTPSDTGSREFDGTYSITPKVFGTYSTNVESVHRDYGTESHKRATRYSSPELPDMSGLPGLDELKRLSAYGTRGEGSVGGGGQHTEIGRDQYHGGQSQYTTTYHRIENQAVPGKFSAYGDGGGEMSRPYRGSPPPPQVESSGRSYDNPIYGDLPPLYREEGGRDFTRPRESRWDHGQGMLCMNVLFCVEFWNYSTNSRWE